MPPCPTISSPDSPDAVRTSRNPADLVPSTWEAVIETVRRFVDIGSSKFVVLPVGEAPISWDEHLTSAAEVLLPLAN
jgi:hypothetical protein